ncbi:hypothetical protein AVEN_181280-1 [Araneus ventricosus]|uniref:Uncharacterized protein n=1 Tax=Araneus ventricosus TaxID=182803 RepID=A0A4Y2NSF2_ARAVE|nr:hypothetical protein AVEN_181280-1 [Araneus ventricosus]
MLDTINLIDGQYSKHSLVGGTYNEQSLVDGSASATPDMVKRHGAGVTQTPGEGVQRCRHRRLITATSYMANPKIALELLLNGNKTILHFGFVSMDGRLDLECFEYLPHIWPFR